MVNLLPDLGAFYHCRLQPVNQESHTVPAKVTVKLALVQQTTKEHVGVM
jgi:hypothetical protein